MLTNVLSSSKNDAINQALVTCSEAFFIGLSDKASVLQTIFMIGNHSENLSLLLSKMGLRNYVY